MLRQGGYKWLGVMAVMRGPAVLCALILVSIVGAGCAADSTGGASAARYATVTPVHGSVTHVPTATPTPAIKEDAALLGGAVYAFDNKLGDSNCCDHNGPLEPCRLGVG